jgi:hypothetical protein
LKNLSSLINLTSLDFQGCTLKGEGAAHLSLLVNLEKLSFRECKFFLGDVALTHISKLEKLVELDCHRCELMTDESLKIISGGYEKSQDVECRIEEFYRRWNLFVDGAGEFDVDRFDQIFKHNRFVASAFINDEK